MLSNYIRFNQHSGMSDLTCFRYQQVVLISPASPVAAVRDRPPRAKCNAGDDFPQEVQNEAVTAAGDSTDY